MTTKELMITGCVTVEGEANHQEICDRLEADLALLDMTTAR